MKANAGKFLQETMVQLVQVTWYKFTYYMIVTLSVLPYVFPMSYQKS